MEEPGPPDFIFWIPACLAVGFGSTDTQTTQSLNDASRSPQASLGPGLEENPLDSNPAINYLAE